VASQKRWLKEQQRRTTLTIKDKEECESNHKFMNRILFISIKARLNQLVNVCDMSRREEKKERKK